MEPLKRLLVSILVLMGSAVATENCIASDSISAAEILHFEQTFENWSREIVANVNPNLKFTVIAKIGFSQTPEQIQEYEDLKMAQHLPGLPEVSDPGYTHPLDSPLYALIAKKEIKVIFHQSVPSQERNVIDEVLRAKMHLGQNDTLTFQIVDSAPVARAPRDLKKAYSLLTVLFGLALVASGFMARRRNRAGKKAQRKEASTKSVSPPAIPAHVQIMNADPLVRREALKLNKAEIVAKATLNCSTRFANEILGELDQEQFDLVNQWILKNKKTVNTADSNYARLLIAAGVQKAETQKFIEKISVLNQRAPRPSEVSL